MKLASQIAQQFKDVYLEGKLVAATNLKEALEDVSWQQATTQFASLNTIAALAFHINYYVAGVANVLKGGTLNIRDKYSYDLPPIDSQESWEQLLNKMWTDAEAFAQLVAQLPDKQLQQTFVDEKYGNYHQNIHGIIDHCYYHLGQIILMKKLLMHNDEKHSH